MCNNGAMMSYSPWNTHFYYQYLQQHARMTQWIQNVHQYLPQAWQNFTNHETYPCSHHNHYQHQQLPAIQQGYHIPHQGYHIPQQGYHIPQQGNYIAQHGNYIAQQGNYIAPQGNYIAPQGNYIAPQGNYIAPQGNYIAPQERRDHHQRQMSLKHRKNSRRNSRNPQRRSRSETGTASDDYDLDAEEKEDVPENDDSGTEWVFNAEPILAFRAMKEELVKEEGEAEEDAKSAESFEFVDAILDENFDFVELDGAGQMQHVIGRKTKPDACGDVQYDREARILLFGDRADRIAGLETSLEIMFDHLNDVHQPVVYPNV